MAVFLVDFDNTCVFSSHVNNEYCEEDSGAAKVLRKLVKNGHKIVLWTCRNSSKNNPYNYDANGKYRKEDSLQEARRWFREKRIPLFGVNHVPGNEELVGEARKPLADFVIDDLNLGIPMIKQTVECINYETGKATSRYVECVDWKKIEKMLKSMKLI